MQQFIQVIGRLPFNNLGSVWFKKTVVGRKGIMTGILLTVFLCIAGAAYAEEPSVYAGVIDLRSWDFETQGEISLAGEYGFFWNELLGEWKEPEEFIAVPTSWVNTNATHGKKYPQTGYATYSLRILLPKNTPALSISIAKPLLAAKIIANGVELGEFGKVGKSADSYMPGVKTRRFALPRHETDIYLLFQVANFDHIRGGLYDEVVIGKSETIADRVVTAKMIEAMIFSFALALGVYHLFLFLFRPKEKSLLCFSVFVFIVALRIMSNGTLIGNELLGLSWLMIVKLEYLTFALIPIPTFLYLYTLYPREMNKPVLAVVIAEAAVYGVITLVTKPMFFASFILFHQIVYLIEMTYVLFVIFLAVKRKRPGYWFMSIVF